MKRFAFMLTLLLLTAAPAWAVPPANAILGKYQQQQAQQRLRTFSAEDRLRFQKLLAAAPSEEERRYLTKALAAGHNRRSLETFASVIRGHDSNWLRNHLHLTNDSQGRGVQQLWEHACGPTTALALFGELDPVFALGHHMAKQADVQKKLLELPTSSGGKGGVAVARGQKNGDGRWVEDLLSGKKRVSGLSFQLRSLQGAYSLDRALRDLDANLVQGIPVPIVIQTGKTLHYSLVLSVWMDKGQKHYAIHDPYPGQTVIRTEAHFRNSQLNLSGNNQLVKLSLPTMIGK